jgi:hypothetical protein
MTLRVRRLAPVLIAVPALSGCATTLDPKSGENLIRATISHNGLGTVQSVKCPSGLQPKSGTAFDCKVQLRDSSGKDHSGTITVHIVPGDKVAILGTQDLHIR